MKTLQRFTVTVLLTLVLAASVFAGDIWTPTPAPPTDPASGTTLVSVETPSTSQPSELTIAVGLNLLLQSFLSVF